MLIASSVTWFTVRCTSLRKSLLPNAYTQPMQGSHRVEAPEVVQHTTLPIFGVQALDTAPAGLAPC